MPQQEKELIVQLRNKTGAGILDCKQALVESAGDLEKATQILREKGIVKMAGRLLRATQEGNIFSYIHPGSKVGVLLEVDCETDFVARTPDFQGLGKELTLQIAAMSPRWVATEEVPAEEITREKEIYRKQLAEEKKPENVIQKIIEGKINNFYGQTVLMEQKWVKDESRQIRQLVEELRSKTGENLKVRRFVRFQVGEE